MPVCAVADTCVHMWAAWSVTHPPARGDRAQEQSAVFESWLCPACLSTCTPGRAGEQPSGCQEVVLASRPRAGARPLSPGLVPKPVLWAPVLPAGLFMRPQRALPLFYY